MLMERIWTQRKSKLEAKAKARRKRYGKAGGTSPGF